jgi:hypothetical protein
LVYVAIAFRYLEADGFEYNSPVVKEYRFQFIQGTPPAAAGRPGTVEFIDLDGNPRAPRLRIRITDFAGLVTDVAEADFRGSADRQADFREFVGDSEFWTSDPSELGDHLESFRFWVRQMTGISLQRYEETARTGFTAISGGADSIQDGQVHWLRWGEAWTPETSAECFEIIGRQVREKTFKTKTVAAHSMKEHDFGWGNLISPGDTITVSPIDPPPPGIMWNAYAAENSAGEVRVFLRISNITAADIFVPREVAWKFEHWPR